jgi:hypothetical protein
LYLENTVQLLKHVVEKEPSMETVEFLAIVHSTPIDFTATVHLTRLGADLGRSTLGTLLALNTLGLTLGGVGSGLGLLSLLAALGSGLLLFGVLDGLLAGGSTSLGAHASSLLDHIEGGTDNGTLGLDNTASTLLGNFLFIATNPSVSVVVFPQSIVFRRVSSSDLVA